MTKKQRLDLQELRQRNKQLERLLKDANLIILALNTTVEVAEEELKTSIRKKKWHQTAMSLRNSRIAPLSVGRLCKLFGKSRQAFCRKEQHFAEQASKGMPVLGLVAAVRRKISGLGIHKLYRLLEPRLLSSSIKIGRDKLHKPIANCLNQGGSFRRRQPLPVITHQPRRTGVFVSIVK